MQKYKSRVSRVSLKKVASSPEQPRQGGERIELVRKDRQTRDGGAVARICHCLLLRVARDKYQLNGPAWDWCGPSGQRAGTSSTRPLSPALPVARSPRRSSLAALIVFLIRIQQIGLYVHLQLQWYIGNTRRATSASLSFRLYYRPRVSLLFLFVLFCSVRRTVKFICM